MKTEPQTVQNGTKNNKKMHEFGQKMQKDPEKKNKIPYC